MKNNFPSRETVECIRKQYPVGCRVELLRMDDAQAPPIGTKGTVRYVDDLGSLGVAWDNGSSLQMVYGEDLCRKLEDTRMDSKVKEQILSIRKTGLTNMFDTLVVQRIAHERNFFELVVFLEEHRDEYARFILTGEG